MNQKPYRAWKFNFPSDRVTETGITTSASGGIEMTSGLTSIQQSLRMLLSIRPGERVMYPGYGCDLTKLAFAQNDETTAGLAIHYIREAVRRWEPRVRILRIDARANPHSRERLDIFLEYRTILSERTENFEYSIDLNQKRL